MEKIKQAVERAKASVTGQQQHPMIADGQIALSQASVTASPSATPKPRPIVGKAGPALSPNEVTLDWSHLEQHRIVAHNVADPRSKVFDMLRTQVLQAMDQKNWQFL